MDGQIPAKKGILSKMLPHPFAQKLRREIAFHEAEGQENKVEGRSSRLRCRLPRISAENPQLPKYAGVSSGHILNLDGGRLIRVLMS